MENPTINIDKDEKQYGESRRANLYKEYIVSEAEGGLTGFTFRPTSDLYVHQLGRSKTVKKKVLSKESSGRFYATDKRLLFLGEGKPLEIPLDGLLRVTIEHPYLALYTKAEKYLVEFEEESHIKWASLIQLLINKLKNKVAADTLKIGKFTYTM
ncbi:MAG: hypothetical protein DRO43_06250 [Candidatus Hecatellales archaeon]|nr:MAG: hypothetical protein DRO43_06250 [Candidatus Hecatellales archaeon]